MRLPGLITKREHDAVKAERDFLADSLETYRGIAETDSRTIATLRARLAPFIAKRDRDARGLFLSTRPVGEMGECGL